MVQRPKGVVMKKLVQTILATAVVFGSLHLKAQEIDHTEGKIMANQMMQIEDVKNNVDTIINTIANRGYGLTGSGLGQISHAIDSITNEALSTQDADKMNALWLEAMEINKDLQQVKSQINIK